MKEEETQQKVISDTGKKYTSLSYNMIRDLVNNSSTPLYIRIKLFLGMWQYKKRKIFCLNNYIAEKFNVTVFQVQYALKKLKDEGTIIIKNPQSFRREIILTEYVFVAQEESEDLFTKNLKLRYESCGKKAYKDNVYLTEQEFKELQELLKDELSKYLNDLDNYIKDNKVIYLSHFETLKKWFYKNLKAKKDKKKQSTIPPKREEPIPEWFNRTVEPKPMPEEQRLEFERFLSSFIDDEEEEKKDTL